MRVQRRVLVKQTVSTSQSVRAQLSLEIIDPILVGAGIVCPRQQLQPDRVEFQSPQSKHPLQRHGKNAAAFAIFRGKSASKKNCHAKRIAVLDTRSSA